MAKTMPGGSALADAAGPLRDLFDRLAGSGGERWLIALKGFLRGELSNERKPPWRVWREVQLGVPSAGGHPFRPLDGLTNLLRVEIGYLDFLSHFSFRIYSEPMIVVLMKVRPMDLGFVEGATHRQLLLRAQAMGLKPCHEEVVARLRPAYDDQPPGERLYVATERLESWHGEGHATRHVSGIFSMVHKDFKDRGSSYPQTEFHERGPLADGEFPHDAEFVFTLSMRNGLIK